MCECELCFHVWYTLRLLVKYWMCDNYHSRESSVLFKQCTKKSSIAFIKNSQRKLRQSYNYYVWWSLCLRNVSLRKQTQHHTNGRAAYRASAIRLCDSVCAFGTETSMPAWHQSHTIARLKQAHFTTTVRFWRCGDGHSGPGGRSRGVVNLSLRVVGGVVIWAVVLNLQRLSVHDAVAYSTEKLHLCILAVVVLGDALP